MFTRQLPLRVPLPRNSVFYDQQKLSLINPPFDTGGYIPAHSIIGSFTGESGFIGSLTHMSGYEDTSTMTEN